MCPPIRMITTLLMHEGNNHSVCAGLGCPRLDSDHISDSTRRGHRSRLLIIKCSRVTTRTNNHTSSSHFSVSGFSLCVHRKQGSAAPAPASPGAKSEKKCVPSCLRRKRGIKRVSWPVTPGWLQTNLLPRRNLFTITFTVTWEIINFSPPPMKRL